MIVIINSSKTMVAGAEPPKAARPPQLLNEAVQLDQILKSYSADELAKVMHISKDLAGKTKRLIDSWTPQPSQQTLAIDSFNGDIYRGLQAFEFSEGDRQYADKVLVILSGLYGLVRPLDAVHPYRLEMMYKLPGQKFKNMYQFWGDKVAKCIPSGPIINATSKEYMDVLTPFIDAKRVIAPRFLTAKGHGKDQTFVTVHGKVARGAFAKWVIKQRIDDPKHFPEFNDLDYEFNAKLSTPQQPTFVRPDKPMLGRLNRALD